MKQINENNIFIAGGGTGGHLFPAVTIGEKLKKRGMKIIYIGSKYGIENIFFKKNNIEAELLEIKGIQRDLSFKSIITNLYFPIRFIRAYFKSRSLIRKFNPKIIIGTGGYSSGLPLLAGIHMKIPTIIQDQNSVPGLITKKLYKKVDLVCLAYKSAFKYLNSKNKIITGNPIRDSLKLIDKQIAKKNLGLNLNKKTIFVLGGSQGSRIINTHILNNIDFYTKNNFQIYLQCGSKNYDLISKSTFKNKNIIIKKFINDMSTIYSASDLVISRAGALAISELCFMGKAMILIPFKHAANNHQELNALEIRKNKACIIINEDELKFGNLENELKNILDKKESIKTLEKKSLEISKKNSTDIIVDKILKIKNA